MNTALFFLSFIFLGTANAQVSNEEFSLRTIDGTTYLTGQIDFPSVSKTQFPLAVLVPGTGIFDREVDFGKTGSDNDFVFRQLAKRLNQEGYAVLRYDYRGISCNQKTVPVCENCTIPQEKMKFFAENCVDNEVRALVTPENIREDIETVYWYGANHQRINRDEIIAFGHSEGSLNLSHLVRDNKIAPKGLVFMGGLAESPTSVVKWQMTGRMFNEMFSFDFDGDGILTNEEIKQGHPNSFLKAIPISELLSDSGSWTAIDLQAKFETNYETTKADAISQPDANPFPGGTITQASYKWWKMFFTDSDSVIENLAGFQGPIFYHNGDIDSQTNFDRQKMFIERASHLFPIPPTIVRHTGRGHTLSEDAIFGPIQDDSMELIVSSFRDLMSCSNSLRK